MFPRSEIIRFHAKNFKKSEKKRIFAKKWYLFYRFI